MALRTGTLTVTKSAAVNQPAEERQADASGENQPRNLPAVKLAEKGFSLIVDGKAKSHYDNAKAASEAGLKLKRAFPVVQIMVLDAVEKIRTLIELPGTADSSRVPDAQIT